MTDQPNVRTADGYNSIQCCCGERQEKPCSLRTPAGGEHMLDAAVRATHNAVVGCHSLGRATSKEQ